jgi:hypothetical protein
MKIQYKNILIFQKLMTLVFYGILMVGIYTINLDLNLKCY